MTQNALSARDRRVLIAGAISVLALVAARRCYVVLHAWENRALASHAETQAKFQTLLASNNARLGAVRAEVSGRRAALDSSFVGVGDRSELVAGLLTRIRELALNNHVTLHAIQPSVDSSHRAVGVLVMARVNITSDVDGLSTFLAQLEGERPLMRIGELSITQSDVFAGADRADVLTGSISIQSLGKLTSTR